MKVVFIILFLLAFNPVYAEEIKPFTSDGCSAFPDGTFDQKNVG